MMYQKYDAYKDSGVQWLGEIPKLVIVRLKIYQELIVIILHQEH
jgi:hypothetical protein